MRRQPFGSPLSNALSDVSELYASLIVNRLRPCHIHTRIDEFDIQLDPR